MDPRYRDDLWPFRDLHFTRIIHPNVLARIKVSDPGWFNSFKSAIAAIFGVQSENRRQQDFQHQSATRFIISGVIIVVCLITSLILLVDWVLSS
ncbi:DUF2970 domain-containing protein [Catenovulum sp. SM1970]|uniref:DUF2970 domain-containing protein n=1 Tax=Marinifaba aquimaris TaxID=2741323 RepID=UPI00157275C9|nr:DUF2970 domain-containing protein [Marinifaba aquimaris]NTS78689.1 DUF2970 domain-containing protein [Marinifaba aquimaris]